jgi:hypothetical protein
VGGIVGIRKLDCVWRYGNTVTLAGKGAVTHPGAHAEDTCFADI